MKDQKIQALVKICMFLQEVLVHKGLIRQKIHVAYSKIRGYCPFKRCSYCFELGCHWKPNENLRENIENSLKETAEATKYNWTITQSIWWCNSTHSIRLWVVCNLMSAKNSDERDLCNNHPAECSLCMERHQIPGLQATNVAIGARSRMVECPELYVS